MFLCLRETGEATKKFKISMIPLMNEKLAIPNFPTESVLKMAKPDLK
jgi:hypothetical protein